MLFNSFAYLIFLPVVVFLFWISPRAVRTLLLLVASYVFYMTWKPIYGLLILGLTVLNFVLGLKIADSPDNKKPWLITAIVANLLLLGVFKYTYFTWEVVGQCVSPLGVKLSAIPFQIILPLGISFFVFEFIHYVSDVYKGGRPVRSFIDFALFASFFPTQIAGPIKRYQDFIPQLANDHKFDLRNLDEGLSLIVFGLFKKVVFADNLAVIVQSAFARPDLLSSLDLWLCTYAFAFQIYFDFSGYTDIARGSAQMLGYKVPPNFNLPYLAGSVSEFWHRWHMSLSTWLRDYLFIPLGGSRGGKLFTWRNLLITMLLGGLWHGAAMHFVVWGAYQGVLLVLHRLYVLFTDRFAGFAEIRQNRLYHALSVVVTFQIVCIGWVFFRAETMETAMAIISKLLFLQPSNAGPLTIVNTVDPVICMLLPLIVAMLLVGQLISGWLASRQRPVQFPFALRVAAVAGMAALLMVFTPDASPKFIYFQF